MMEKNSNGNAKLGLIVAGIALILITQGCNHDQALSERPSKPAWFGHSIVDDVYEPAIVEDVYLKQ